MRRTAFLVVAITGPLAACGQMAPLQPAVGQTLPVKPLMAQSTPSAEDLLDRPTYANPDRVDELIRRSEPRRADRFDLPPPAGAALPPAVPPAPDDPMDPDISDDD